MYEGGEPIQDELTSLRLDSTFQADQDRNPRARQVVEGGKIERHAWLFLREDGLIEGLAVIVRTEIIETVGVIEADNERLWGLDGGEREHDGLISGEHEKSYEARAAN